VRPKGIRRTLQGWQAYVRVRGKFYARRFPPDTALTTMKQWREEQRVRVRLGATLTPPPSTFAEDVAVYLAQVRSMPTFAWRKQDLRLWLDALGHDRDRRTITALEVGAQLETWRQHYAASTVNHRRTALMHLFSKLDGKSAPNPAKDVPRYKAEDRGPRGMHPRVIRTILAHMQPSQTKARLLLMAWTGWPQMTLERLTPADIRWGEYVYVKRRRKGQGVVGERVPLLPEAWKALREFKRWGCWGTFSRDSMNASWQRAVTKTQADRRVPQIVKDGIVEDAVPYDLRHSFGTLVADVTRDDTAVQKLMRHSDPRQTAHYMRAIEDARMQDAVWRVAKELPRLLKSSKQAKKSA
jgi:integrase